MQTLKEARKYAYDLVSDGRSQYHMLDNHDAEVLTGLIINSTDKIHIWEYITEADFKNELPTMLAEWLISDNDSLGLHILDTLKHNAIRYASKECVKILEEQVQEWEIDRKLNGD